MGKSLPDTNEPGTGPLTDLSHVVGTSPPARDAIPQRPQSLSTLPPFRAGAPLPPPTLLDDVRAVWRRVVAPPSDRSRAADGEQRLRALLRQRTDLLAAIGANYVAMPASGLVPTLWHDAIASLRATESQLAADAAQAAAAEAAHERCVADECAALLATITQQAALLQEKNTELHTLEAELAAGRRAERTPTLLAHLAQANVRVAEVERERTFLQKHLAELREDEANRRERLAEAGAALGAQRTVIAGATKDLERRRRRVLAEVGETAVAAAPPDELRAVESQIAELEASVIIARRESQPLEAMTWVRGGGILASVALAVALGLWRWL